MGGANPLHGYYAPARWIRQNRTSEFSVAPTVSSITSEVHCPWLRP